MRPTIKNLLRLAYLILLLLALLLVIKPGASIFYFKALIDKDKVTKDDGHSYLYHIVAHPLFRYDTILVYENDRPLLKSDLKGVVNAGNGRFALGETENNQIEIYFGTFQNIDPGQIGNKLTLYLHYAFMSRVFGMVALLLLLLLPFLLGFIIYVSRKSTIEELRHKPAGIVSLQTFTSYLRDRQNWGWFHIYKPDYLPSRRIIYQRLVSIYILAIYLYIFMEWIFLVTKPSFMDFMRLTDKVFILLASGLGVSILSLLILAILGGIDLLIKQTRLTDIVLDLMPLLPALVLASISLILIDNFTYTVLGFGIVSTTTGITRWAYTLLFIIIFIYFYYQIGPKLFENRSGYAKEFFPGQFYIALTLLVISIVPVLMNLNELKQDFTVAAETPKTAADRPNIILLSGDGINAANLSVYGYERETTPNLNELARISILAENNFTNAGSSTGSDIAILTGKLPLQTRVLYTPNILSGKDAYQHLPAILKRLGYFNVEFGVEHYVDANDQNLQNGFDIVNGVKSENNPLIESATNYWFDDSIYFLSELFQRIDDRLSHILFIRDMQNTYKIAAESYKYPNDREKIDELLSTLENAKQPLFVHMHLMGTHGPKFNPSIIKFSKGEIQSDVWMRDFYDDAILEFDAYVGEVIEYLKQSGKYADTILVIYTDHPELYHVNQRIPLIIHLPENQDEITISSNTQNLDIAPTLLDYLDVQLPSWMEGRSLLDKNLDPHRLIVSATTNKTEEVSSGIWNLDEETIKPPFFQFSRITVIDCQTWYTFDTSNFAWSSGEIAGHTAPCSNPNQSAQERVEKYLYEKLATSGFDISKMVK